MVSVNMAVMTSYWLSIVTMCPHLQWFGRTGMFKAISGRISETVRDTA